MTFKRKNKSLYHPENSVPSFKNVYSLSNCERPKKNFYALKDLNLRYVSILGLPVGSLVLSSLALESPTIALCLLYLRINDDPININQ